jgi:DNA-binding HxlR family transcriptional regulator
MEKKEKKYFAATDCPVTAAIGVIGGKWKPIIIFVLMQGPHRFGELHKSIPGIALKVLSRQLKELEEDDIVHREVFAEVPPRVVYSLTTRGQGLTPVIELLTVWSRANLMIPAVQ